MSAATRLAVLALALALPSSQALAQARGVVIQIPDDVAPGSPRPTPPPVPQAPAPQTQAPFAPSPAGPPASNGSKAACRGASCAQADPNAWHVVNTANRTCLVLSKNDLKGGKDVRRLATLLPAPLFVVASGACP